MQYTIILYIQKKKSNLCSLRVNFFVSYLKIKSQRKMKLTNL